MAKGKKEDSKASHEELSSVERARLMRDQINAQMKKNLIQNYTSDSDNGLPRISSGIPTLDRILGKGPNGYGWARGRFHGIFGPSSAGKSTLVLTCIAEAQKEGLVVLVDSECAYDPSYASKIGVDIDSLLIMNPSCSEEAFDAIESIIKSNQVRMIVIDSLDGLVPRNIVEASADDQFMGLAARTNNRFFAKMQILLHDNDCTLIVVSQTRDKIGGYGNPETVNGGKALLFYATTRLEIRRDEDIIKSGEKIGHIAKVITRKNRASNPQQTAFFRIDWGYGVNKEKCILDIALADGVVNKGGAWFAFEDRKIQGEESFISELRNNSEFRESIIEKLQ
jgi:recombination protein RecA